jgi:multicomponent K+:H+ antiporter subunit E
MSRLRERISPTLVLALVSLWLMLNQSFAPAHVVVGILIALAIAWATSGLRPLKARLRRVDAVAHLILVVLKEVVYSNIRVARILLGLVPVRDLHSGFVRIPLELRDPHGLAALAAIVTATPGTVWSGLSPEGDVLTLHVLELIDEAAVIRLVKQRFEQPLMRIFE